MASRGWALAFITLVHVWGVLPLVSLILIAGLQSIPDDVYSASAVDGAVVLFLPADSTIDRIHSVWLALGAFAVAVLALTALVGRSVARSP